MENLKWRYVIFVLVIIIAHFISKFDRLNFTYLNQGNGSAMNDSKIGKDGDLESKEESDNPEEFSKYFILISKRITDNNSSYSMNYQKIEFEKSLNSFSRQKLQKNNLDWIFRGPSNVGGRTRGLVIDPDDAQFNTWFAGAASGGLWKTEDGGLTWTNLSQNLTNLNISALEMANSNHNVLYAGTGESFPGSTGMSGNGIWKSEDRGQTWSQLQSTATNLDFAYVNRVAILPTNENVILAATETGILKSADGGLTWYKKYNSDYGVEDIEIDQTNNNVAFAGEYLYGILKSEDGGETWNLVSKGMELGTRYELSISPVNHNWVYASVNVSSSVSRVYVSTDNGATWNRFNDSQNFLSSQGDYDNTIQADPYNMDEAYVGGVDIWKLKFNGSVTTTDPVVLSAYTVNTDFLDFINFGGDFLQGGMSTKEGNNLTSTDWVPVEIRFGQGLSQLAHRFTVPTQATSGVEAINYTYVDYVAVPFQVWDVKNNRQLMVSFRDQEKDGLFNLYPRTGDAYGQLGREYIFVNSVEYSLTPDPAIAVKGGHLYKNLYMFWPSLEENSNWDPVNLPDSKIVVDCDSIQLYSGEKTSIADSYGSFGGPNGYDQTAGIGKDAIPGLHPDHHNLKVIPIGDGNVKIIDANDGGLGISMDNGLTFTQLPNNYLTTQFYGIAKHPTKNEYMGGMQDNGTWRSPAGEDANSDSKYLFQLGGDGFECIWNVKNPLLLLGSLYYNNIKLSRNGGASWINVAGIDASDGPFITKLSVSKEDPDLVFALGSTGIYRSANFGTSWSKKNINTNWTIDNYISSAHKVEVSQANGNIVWAGGGMAKDFGLQMQVSVDEGLKFNPVNDYTLVKMDAYISGLATHPFEDSTAFVMFSLSNLPKVLKTKDLGQTWEDISGFGTNTSSSNGFPDVMVHCLVVMPYNPDIIWVGTEIGLFESDNGGESWHYSNNGLPPVAIYQMKVFGDQVVLATHGRGIWSVTIPELLKVPFISEFKQKTGKDLLVTAKLYFVFDSVEVYLNNLKVNTLTNNTIGNNQITVSVDKGGKYWSRIRAYKDGVAYFSNTMDLQVTLTSTQLMEETSDNITIFPNPANKILNFKLDENYKMFNIEICTINGSRIFTSKFENQGMNSLNTEFLPEGAYFINLFYDNRKSSKTIIIKH
ncbi:MAG: T9SS type A sorting domain-containing protein [Bacteroidales bacterium]